MPCSRLPATADDCSSGLSPTLAGQGKRRLARLSWSGGCRSWRGRLGSGAGPRAPPTALAGVVVRARRAAIRILPARWPVVFQQVANRLQADGRSRAAAARHQASTQDDCHQSAFHICLSHHGSYSYRRKNRHIRQKPQRTKKPPRLPRAETKVTVAKTIQTRGTFPPIPREAGRPVTAATGSGMAYAVRRIELNHLRGSQFGRSIHRRDRNA